MSRFLSTVALFAAALLPAVSAIDCNIDAITVTTPSGTRVLEKPTQYQVINYSDSTEQLLSSANIGVQSNSATATFSVYLNGQLVTGVTPVTSEATVSGLSATCNASNQYVIQTSDSFEAEGRLDSCSFKYEYVVTNTFSS